MEVTLYTIDGCERCAMVKRMLDAHDVTYKCINDKELMIKNQFQEAPTIVVDGKIFDNFTSVLRWLEQNNLYSP